MPLHTWPVSAGLLSQIPSLCIVAEKEHKNALGWALRDVGENAIYHF